ncbi:methylated-DNA--[protein]-cysteine S-methyltransferase [Aliarcobacter thereius]|uniref:methylated-DNA--[protein]-cysteine S-methyltransferase n=1 Tax=Aliarcobacter thereius TaxID=544718 RepID=A0A5R9H4W4_9BACT|nr:methylated-DNA--[protein]-cysteine S-methyltransferase [Aliarcobacter thereius]TLS71118.1 methylated-DNA--[protein]-cysteine S-methyltransferase [Aliarcobacter thereius]TLT06722.1 methylated-DNA--[protein]-cysteine S-methyltransferase [Aliarcobacter thereius]
MNSESKIFFSSFTIHKITFQVISYDSDLIYLSPFSKDFNKSLEFFKKELNSEYIEKNDEEFIKLKEELIEYFNNKRDSFTISYKIFGTEFQKKVWNILTTIPYGKTISYKEEASMLGNEKAFRAVANANGKNRISIIIPCHRVISHNGEIGGYTGGIDIKKELLRVESINQKY